MRNLKKNSWKNEIENNNVARLKRRKQKGKSKGKIWFQMAPFGGGITIVVPKMQGDNVGIGYGKKFLTVRES